MSYLLVGDMHVKKENLVESQRVIDWVMDIARQEQAIIVFMGDQYDTMAIKRVEVEEFWHDAYEKIQSNVLLLNKKASISLTGNHDLNSDGSASAMTVHKHHTAVVPNAMSVFKDFGAIGYIRDNQDFIKCAFSLYAKGLTTILCHAEFNGAEYENGFYAPGGINLEECPPVLFISGHIHKAQKLDAKNGAQVLYIGTPRHLTRSDAGQTKGITLLKDGALKFIPTPTCVAEPFVEVVVQEGTPFDQSTIPTSGRVYIDVKGSKDYVADILKKLPEGVRVRTFVDSDLVVSEIKESEGVLVALRKYVDKYFVAEKVPAEVQKLIEAEMFDKLTGKVANE